MKTRQSSNFVHLHVHTQFSLLDGACRLNDLIDLTKKYGMPACAITDHGNMFGAVEFDEKAVAAGIKPIIGCEIYVAPESRFNKTSHGMRGAGYHLVLLAKNNTGYKHLMEIVSLGYLEGFYYKPRVDKEVLARCSKGIIALSACLKGEVPHFLMSDQWEEAKRVALEYSEIFGSENFYLELQDNRIEEQEKINKSLIRLSAATGLGLVATSDVHYLNKSDAKAHDALLCIQTQTNVSDTNRMRFQTDEMYFKSPEEMAERFSSVPEALKNTVKIAERCNVDIDFSTLHLPAFTHEGGKDNDSFFTELIDAGIKERYAEITPEIKKRVEHEISIIRKSGYISYFLIVWDFIRYARSKDIPVGPGRGSAAGSIVSYALRITDLDPIKYGLIFERFLNPERVSMPDIDIDFCFERRNEVIEYVIEKYSKDNVAQIITFGSMKAKGVLRDVGRVMGVAYAEVDRLAKLVPNTPDITLEKAIEIEPEMRMKYEDDPVLKQVIDISIRLQGLNRHASTHAAGVVISDKPLIKRIPLFKTPDDQITTGYAMTSLDKIGMLKMDFLGLKTLTVIYQAIKIIKRTRGEDVDFKNIPLDDNKTFELLSRAETGGVFQLESGGMRDLLRKLKPSRFEELIAILALYRPGPMGSGMLDDFIKRKQGEVKVKYDHPLLEKVLEETYGIIVFQEQVMRVVSVMGGFSMAEADNVRKIMGKKIKDPKKLDAIKAKFISGALKNKVDSTTATKVWDFISHFAGYGFNKSHSAAYSMISYRTAYLKANYPVEFMSALLTSEKDNSDKISDYINESIRMGIEILPPDVNESFRDFTVVEKDVRFGLSAVKNVGGGSADAIIATREDVGKYESIFDFAMKVDSKAVNRKVLESMIKCGAFDSTGIRRSQAMSVLEKVIDVGQKANKDRNIGQLSFFDEGLDEGNFRDTFHDVPDIPEWPESELLANEKEMLGFYITKHPLARFERLLNAYSTCKIPEMVSFSDGHEVLIGGIINKVKITVTRKKGEKMAIFTLEDLNSFVEVLAFPRTYAKFHEMIKGDSLVYVWGKVNRREEEPKIIAENIIFLEQVKEKYTRSVLIKLSSTGLEESMMKRVKFCIQKFRGKVPVLVDILSPEGRKIRVSVDAALHVNPTDELLAAIEEIVGSGNVKFLTK